MGAFQGQRAGEGGRELSEPAPGLGWGRRRSLLESRWEADGDAAEAPKMLKSGGWKNRICVSFPYDLPREAGMGRGRAGS